MKTKHPQEICDRKRQVTIQFKTVEEKKMFMKWYAGAGSSHFWGLLASYGPKWWKTKSGLKWRKVAEDRLKNWPKDNERFVE